MVSRLSVAIEKFVVRGYNLYNFGIESHRIVDALTTEAETLVEELLGAQVEMLNSYDLP
jgi:hypothetical protein